MLKLNVGLSRKVGEANYGSRGASVNLELELDTGLIREPDQLQEKIRYLYRLARQSVQAELEGSTQETTASNNNGNGNGHQSRPNGRSATQSQVRAIYAITKRQGVDLDALLQHRYQIHQADDLSISEASKLIDELKSASTGGQR